RGRLRCSAAYSRFRIGLGTGSGRRTEGGSPALQLSATRRGRLAGVPGILGDAPALSRAGDAHTPAPARLGEGETARRALRNDRPSSPGERAPRGAGQYGRTERTRGDRATAPRCGVPSTVRIPDRTGS